MTAKKKIVYVTSREALDEIKKAIDKVYNTKKFDGIEWGKVKKVLQELYQADRNIDLRDRLNDGRKEKEYVKGYFLGLVESLLA